MKLTPAELKKLLDDLDDMTEDLGEYADQMVGCMQEIIKKFRELTKAEIEL